MFFLFKNQICNGVGPLYRSRMDENKLQRCMFCFEVCSVEHAEIAAFNCPSCKDIHGHMNCIIKRTSQRQRILLQKGAICDPPVRCPRVVESGVCGCPLENLRILKEKDVLRKRAKASMKAFESFTLICRGFSPDVSEMDLEAYFQIYGFCRCVLISSESNEASEAYVTFSEVEPLILALDDHHILDDSSELQVEPVFNVERYRKQITAQHDLRRPENCLLVGPIPDQVTDLALTRYFEDFGVVLSIERPGKGFARVFVLDAGSVEAVLGISAHSVDGIPVIIRTAAEGAIHQRSRSSTDSRRINSVSPWKMAQAFNPMEFTNKAPEESNAPRNAPKILDSTNEEEEFRRALRASLAAANVHATGEDEKEELRRALEESAAEFAATAADLEKSHRSMPPREQTDWDEGSGRPKGACPGESLSVSEKRGRRLWQPEGSPVQPRIGVGGGDGSDFGGAAKAQQQDARPASSRPAVPFFSAGPTPRGPVLRRYQPLGAEAQGGGPAPAGMQAASRHAKHAPGAACGSGLSRAGGGAEDAGPLESCGAEDGAGQGLDTEEQELLSLLLCSAP